MKILITGGTGFIGNYVVNELINNNHDLIVLGRRNREELDYISWIEKVDYIKGDISDKKDNWFEFLNKPEMIIHLAWQDLPNYSELFHIERNLYNDYFFLKNLAENGLNNFSITGTCFEYGTIFGELSENMNVNPNNPYAIAKNTLRIFMEELRKKYNFNLKWIRLFYPYGDGQGSNSILSLIDKAIENNDKVFNMSGGEQLRDYLNVKSMSEYILKISLQNEITGIINCCSGEPISIRKLVEDYLYKKKSNIKLNLGYYPYPLHEPMAFWGCRNKLNKIIN